MGTNYYLYRDYCPYCKRGKEIIHLGKKSCGWRFLFHGSEEIPDYKSFCRVIKTGIIRDEYNRIIPYNEMIKIAKSRLKSEKPHDDAEDIDGYDFMYQDFC